MAAGSTTITLVELEALCVCGGEEADPSAQGLLPRPVVDLRLVECLAHGADHGLRGDDADRAGLFSSMSAASSAAAVGASSVDVTQRPSAGRRPLVGASPGAIAGRSLEA